MYLHMTTRNQQQKAAPDQSLPGLSEGCGDTK
jgi:hypothetical protein